MNLAEHAAKHFSQFSEDGCTLELCRRLGPPTTFVEIGAGDGQENCTRVLAEMGWSGFWLDAHEPYRADLERTAELYAQDVHVRIERITVRNLRWVFREEEIPKEIGVLSIDVDGNDYWLWNELGRKPAVTRPWIVVIEAQIQRDHDVPYVMSYDPAYIWPGGDNVPGASIFSMVELGKTLGYAYVGKCPDYHSPNVFFVRDDLADRL